MNESEQRLQRHYRHQQLPPERVQAILAAGRAAAAEKNRGDRWLMAAAAAVIFGLGFLGSSFYLHGRMPSANSHLIRVETLASAVTDFFGDSKQSLARFSTDRHVLVEWLHDHGGPAKFEPPRAMQNLPALGCQVLEVGGQHVYMICFSLEGPAPVEPSLVAAAEVSPPSPITELSEKRTPQIVHLMVTTKSSFIDPPKAGERIVLPARGAWNFTTWSKGDQTFLAAGTIPAERLSRLVAAL